MLRERIASYYGVDPKFIEETCGVYVLNATVGKAQEPVKIPLVPVDCSGDVAGILPSHDAIASFIMRKRKGALITR